MKQFLGKERERKNPEGKQRRDLYLRVKCLYQKLDNIYGTKGLVLRASKFDAIDLMSSEKLENKVLALQKILQEDPTINGLKEDIAAVVDSLEEMVVDTCSQKVIEEELQKRVQKRMEEKYEDYLRDIKLQIIKEQNSSPENAQTLKKLGQLEKMERVGLNRPALEVLRPLTLDEVVGQNRAIKSLIANLNTPYPQHILLYGPPGVGKTTCARLALEIAKKREESIFSPDAPFIEVDGTTLRW
ncbi:MAG: AAA family ATPase, partial [Syntrophomonadaceae bacterium]|nr:AAA family ATPase [Syntrophomonadaceae bacterium]